jgi:SPP1 gp7 family putative phage head morphogenesis protein
MPNSPFEQDITLDDIRYLIRRDELAYRTLMRWSGAVFNRWLTYTSDNPDREKKVREIYERLNVKSIFKRAYMLSKADGWAIVALGWVESDPDATKEPGNVSDIDYIHAIPSTSITFIHQDLDPLSDKYGEITAYTIKQPTGVKEQTNAGAPVDKQFPAARFLHWRNDFIDDDPKGISIFEPLYDKFVVKKNQDFAMGEVMMSMAKPFPVLTLPDDADDPEIDAADTMLENLDVKSHLVKPKAYDFDLKGPQGTLNPRPYTDYTLSTLAAGSLGSKVALLGTEAGAVTGSEINIGEWYVSVSDEQANVVQPMLKEFNRRLEEYKLIPPGSDDFAWAPLYELDSQEEAQVQLNLAQAASAVATAVTAMEASGWHMFTKDDKVYWYKGGDVIEFSGDFADLIRGVQDVKPPVEAKAPAPPAAAPPAPGAPPGAPAAPPQAPPGARAPPPPPGQQQAQDTAAKAHARSAPAAGQNADAPYLDPLLRDQLFADVEIQTADLENRLAQIFVKHVTLIRDEFFARLKSLWVKNVGPIVVDPTAPVARVNDTSDLYGDLTDWETKDLAAFRADLVKFLTEAYQQGDAKTLQDLGVEVPTRRDQFGKIDEAAIKKIEVEGARLAKQTYLDNHKQALNEIADGIRAGQNYAQIADRIAQKFAEYNDGIPATVQKFIHTVKCEARWDTMQSNGFDKGVYLTARDERVRDSHRAMDGKVVTREQAMPYLSEFGCRCVVSPLTVYDEYVAQAQEGA